MPFEFLKTIVYEWASEVRSTPQHTQGGVGIN